MPVSHLGLTVSHIPSATSFYLSALQPLGYRYIGQQRDSIGLGIDEADFFLNQAKNGARVSPTHVAFTANNRLKVRDCYTAALNAGGCPSGPPEYRNNECSCFNAAVEDLDGNTVEFIFREPALLECIEDAPGRPTAARPVRNDMFRSGVDMKDDLRSPPPYSAKSRSRAQTALDLASATSATSKSVRNADGPVPGISRSKTEPVDSMNKSGGNAVVGTLLGAAAGAAFAYAMVQSERESARGEAAVAASTRARGSRPQSSRETASLLKKSQRDRSGGEAPRQVQQPPRSVPAIEAARYYDSAAEEKLNQYDSTRRPIPQRSRTYDAAEYAPRAGASSRNDRFSTKRASTLPLDVPDYYLEYPKSAPASRHTSRRGSIENSQLQRHDSGVSMRSHRPRRSSFGNASTTKPGRRGSMYEPAAGVPLPSSKATSRIAGSERTPRASRAHSYTSAAQMRLPDSKATSYISAAQVPNLPSNTAGGNTDFGEESDGLDDIGSVVPDDSISCVDFSKPKKSSSRTSRPSSKRSEADSERTMTPAKETRSKHSAMTLPRRSKEESNSRRTRSGKRSTATYA